MVKTKTTDVLPDFFLKELRYNNHIDFTFNHYRLQLKGGTTCFGSQFEDRAHRNGGSRV